MWCVSISRSILNFWATLPCVEADTDQAGMSPVELMELCLLPPMPNFTRPSQNFLIKQHLAKKCLTCLLRQAGVFLSPSCYWTPPLPTNTVSLLQSRWVHPGPQSQFFCLADQLDPLGFGTKLPCLLYQATERRKEREGSAPGGHTDLIPAGWDATLAYPWALRVLLPFSLLQPIPGQRSKYPCIFFLKGY